MTRYERTPQEWFAQAAQMYVERHQACAWCGGSHRVSHTKKEGRSEYLCTGCDFRAGYEAAVNRFYSYPGEEQAGKKPVTMLAI
jgi:hypothetical protein